MRSALPVPLTVFILAALLLVGCVRSPAETPAATPQPALSATATPTRTATPRLKPTGQRTLRVTRVPTLTITPRADRPVRIPTTTPIPVSPAGPLLAPPPALREVIITDIRGHAQRFPLGCEASAAVDWAAYFGVDVHEGNFQISLPVSDNPDKGFVGNVNDTWGMVPPFSYGVHAGPVAALLRDQYGLPATARKGFTIEQIKAEIDRGQPVIAWVIGNVNPGRAVRFTDRVGDEVIVAAYEHVVIVTGYSELDDTIRYMNNGRFYVTSTTDFQESYAVLGSMALFFEEPG